MTDTTQFSDNAEQKSSGVRLIVCLGNPGAEYAETRHNAGFKVGEQLIMSHRGVKAAWQPDNGELFDLTIAGRAILLLKPMTYMNASGDAVVGVAAHFGISPSEVLIISDCLDLPLGRLRMRPGGSSGGQKGVRSILVRLETEAVPRLRVGIGRPQSSECSVIDYVLSPWTSVEQEVLPEILRKAADMAEKAVSCGLEVAMNECNSWSADNNNAEKKQGDQR